MAQWKIYYRLKKTANLNSIEIKASRNSDDRRLAEPTFGQNVDNQRVIGA